MKKANLLYINGRDAWLEWSALLIEDSYDNLLLPAGMKEYAENDFRSMPGKQVLFKDPQPQARNIQLMFAITCGSRQEYLEKFHSLVQELTGGLVELRVIPLMSSYNVYLPENCFLSLGSSTGMNMGKLSVRMCEPDPTDRITGDRVLPWVFKDGKWQQGFWLKSGKWAMDME